MMSGTALIIGATGGIGYAFVTRLASLGYDLLLVDKDHAGLAAAARDVRTHYAVAVETAVADFAHNIDAQILALDLRSRPPVNMLVYAAGYAQKQPFLDKSMDGVYELINIHMLSVMNIIHAVTPSMIKAGSGDIIVVSSLGAFIPAPGSGVYAGAKSMLNTFLESFYMEVRSKNIRVQALCPGMTATRFHTDKAIARFNRMLGSRFWMDPGVVVERSLRNLVNGPVIYIPGFINKLIRIVVTILPRRCYYLIAKAVIKRL